MSEDLIRRSDAIKEVKRYRGLDRLTMAMLADDIRAIPTIEPKRGENLRKEYDSLFECSICGASCDDTYPWDCDINFCPNCGARMKGADDE